MGVVRPNQRGVLLGLAAAVTFGASAPLAKVLLDHADPVMLAGLLYLGAFAALALVGRRDRSEARLRRADTPRVALLVVSGGVLAPVLLLVGLQRVSGTSGSLLLNLEGPFTIAIGIALFGEHLSRRALLGAVLIFGGAVALGAGTGATRADWVGIALIAGACACWALDNNVTQSLTLRDPRTIVLVKCGVAGACNLALALTIGQQLPAIAYLAAALGLGAVSYGISILLDAHALRILGAAREAAVFAVAPFVGALLAPFVLPESIGVGELVAGVLMAIGITFLLRERHTHLHTHEVIVHDHRHVHDEHHQHSHPEAPVTEPHSHVHRHEVLEHAHPHVSD
ncbi:MAG TPA: EamA family transporter, partial [Gaiellaceae bacterium]|nr:EamA family transporter [Gaiellaceae bacterium]